MALQVKLLLLEFPWLCSITLKRKSIVLSHKHKHMHEVHVCSHPTQCITQFTEPCPIMAWSYHISWEHEVSTSMWSDRARSGCTREHCGNVLVLSRSDLNTFLFCEAVCCQSEWWSADQRSHHQARLTAVEMQSGTSTFPLLVYKCDLGRNAGIGEIQPDCCRSHAGLRCSCLQSHLAMEQ